MRTYSEEVRNSMPEWVFERVEPYLEYCRENHPDAVFCSARTRTRRGRGDDQPKDPARNKERCDEEYRDGADERWRILQTPRLENSLVRLDGQGGRLGGADVCILRSLLSQSDHKVLLRLRNTRKE